MSPIFTKKLALLFILTLRFKLALLFIIMMPIMAGCTALLSKQTIRTTYYSLELSEFGERGKFGEFEPKTLPDLNTYNTLPILIVNAPKAAPGFDTQRMMYTRAPHQLEYFARSEWIDTPAHMLQPLIISTIEKTGAFNAVLAKQSVVASDIRLDSEVIKLVQIFTTKPSYVQFTLRASMIDNVTNKVIALKEFDERVDASSDNPMAGVVAANLAVNQVLYKLSVFTQQIVNKRGKSRVN